jgi:hypothetical protein
MVDESERAKHLYGPPTSTQESLGVLLEEFDELKAAIHANNRRHIMREAIQVAAVAYRLAFECSRQQEAFMTRSGLTNEERDAA